jgi:Tol biopolymer transport system component
MFMNHKKLLALYMITILLVLFWGCSKDTHAKPETIYYGNFTGRIAFARPFPARIVVIDFNNKSTRTITTKWNGTITDGFVSLSPDGEIVTFSGSTKDNSSQIFTMSVNDGSYSQLTNPFSSSSIFYDNQLPIWSTEGTKIYYINPFWRLTYTAGQVYSIFPDGKNIIKIDSLRSIGRISVTKEENLILASGFSGIFSYDVQKKTAKQLTYNDSTSIAVCVVLSPDEQKIAYVLRHGANEYGTPPYYFKIMTVDIDGTSEKTVINLPWNSYWGTVNVVWSPDGTKLAYNVGGADYRETDHLFIINLDGTGLTQITNSSFSDGAPSWIK